MKTNIYATKAYKLGNSGENKVQLMLNTFNPPEFNIHNIILKDEKNNTHQIDLICITHAGIFVIEVKNVCGYKIYCENDKTYWTYDWIKNKQKITCKLYNPIWQNREHVAQIKKILPDFPIYSMVTFSNNNTLIHEQPLNDIVVNLKSIKSYIQKFTSTALSDKDMLYAKEIILKNHHPEISLTEHIKNVTLHSAKDQASFWSETK